MTDSIVISATCADAASPEPLPSEGQTAEATFGPFLVHYLDHSEYEAQALAERSRHTRVSHRLSRMIPRLLSRAGLAASDLSGPRAGLISGSSYGCGQVFDMHRRLRLYGPRGIDAVRFAQATHNYPVSACAIEYGMQGTCLSVVSTETAGLDALQCAVDWLREDRCDRVIVAAYEDIASPIADHLVARARALPGKAFGEAMVLVMLERGSAAINRGRMGLPVVETVMNLPRLSIPLGRAEIHTTCPAKSFLNLRPRTLDYLGASGLLAIHDLLKSPDAGQQGAAQWQIAMTASAGNGVAAGIKIHQMEFSQ